MSVTDTESTDIFNVDTMSVSDADTNTKKKELAPVYRIYEGSRIAVSSQLGKMWDRKIRAAMKAYEQTALIWDEVFRYYNNNQSKGIATPRGLFKRGDGTENVMFSNLNIMLPAVYSKDPDITCSTVDDSEEDFCRTLQTLLNTLLRQKMQAKMHIKKAVGIGLLTNFGIVKMDWTRKDDSREIAVAEMAQISEMLASAKTTQEVENLYGRLEALEMNMEVMKPSGPSLRNVLPHNLIIDPNAELPDGSDGEWMAERVWLPTAMLQERFTKPDPESEVADGDASGATAGARVLIYKPTHKVAFDSGDGRRDDGLGFVQQALETGYQNTHHTDDERTAYINMYSTECYLVWDKLMRRVMLFHRDDWKWPLWVWDDPLNLSRFFPYFILAYNMSTGGTVAPGEAAYYLDQQDELNEINRKLQRMRSAVFDYFFYNSDVVDSDQIQKMINAIRGQSVGDVSHVVGVKAGEKKISDLIESIVPKMDQFKELFNKQDLLDSINRITNTSDALRGVQFKTNTNEDAVNTYQEAMKLSVGAKVDVVEDVVADLALSLAECTVQFMTPDDVAALIGPTLGAEFRNMTVEELNANYNLEIVAGSMEKPNSVFKKKEAVQIAQAVGQFAQAAPGATLTIMLRVMEQAFSEVVIKPADWQMLNAEIQAKTGQGLSQPGGTSPGVGTGGPATPSTSGGGGANPSSPSPQPGGVPGADGGNIQQILQNIPDAVKQQVVAMRNQGADPHAIMSFLLQHIAGQNGGSSAPPTNAPQTGVH